MQSVKHTKRILHFWLAMYHAVVKKRAVFGNRHNTLFEQVWKEWVVPEYRDNVERRENFSLLVKYMVCTLNFLEANNLKHNPFKAYNRYKQLKDMTYGNRICFRI